MGLNPSDNEFRVNKKVPVVGPSLRFPRAQHLDAATKDDGFYREYIAALSGYFRNNPYNWFSCYEPILQGMGGSYYEGAGNITLHTDLCSPLATNPTWNGLSSEQREQLEHDGTNLWHQLVEYLNPHIVVASVARWRYDLIPFNPVSDWQTIHTVLLKANGTPRKTSYPVQARRDRSQNGIPYLLIHGTAANTPFGTVAAADKRKIGESIIKEYIGEG